MSFALYLDEDSSDTELLDALHHRKADVISAVEAGMAGFSDEAQLLWATEHNRAIYTFNASDFSELHREFSSTGREHAGIIIGVQQLFSVGEQARRLLALIHSPVDLRNTRTFLKSVRPVA